MRKLLIATALFLGVAFCAQARPFFFIQISDPQMGFREKNTIEQSVKLLTEAVEAINRLHPAFVVVTGDMTTNRFSEPQWEAYQKLIGSIDKDIPVWHVPGNHDLKPLEDGDFEHYLSRYGYDRFAFRYKGCAFIGLNTCFLKDNCFEQEREHYSWLLTQLEKFSGARHKFVFTHCPIVKENLDEEEDYFNFQAPYRTLYLNLFESNGVDAVFSGHFHRTRFFEKDGVQYFTTGPSGQPLGDGTTGINIVTVTRKGFTARFVAPKDAVNPLESGR